MDIGLTNYFIAKTGCPHSEIALETPAFATLGSYEIDFYVKSMKEQKTYAVEVNFGRNSSKTIEAVQQKNRADVILFTKRKQPRWNHWKEYYNSDLWNIKIQVYIKK